MALLDWSRWRRCSSLLRGRSPRRRGAAGAARQWQFGGAVLPADGRRGRSGGIGQQQNQERERTTWLAEDEDVWGTDPQIGPAVLGRDFLTDDEDIDGYDDFDEPAPQPRRDPSRIRAR